MGAANYMLLSSDGASDNGEHSKRRPLLPYLALAVMVALSSLSLNAFLLFRQYATPWDLAAELPSRYVREYINENHDKIPHNKQSWDYPHVMHCMNIVREGIICSADDTPLYMGQLNENINATHPIVGAGFNTMCRDWGAMMGWARNNSACFTNRFEARKTNISGDERYMNCPDGAKPWLKQPVLSTGSDDEDEGIEFGRS
ncbi:hypothetical protein ANO11243_027330 [Dothideomycetidae sp. 11243]|nr:hypothetical protein ANO11243_027330 [fungal sp. No.11243]